MPVALVESAAGRPGELHVCRILPVGEVRIAVAELLRSGRTRSRSRKLDGRLNRVAVVGEARGDVLGGGGAPLPRSRARSASQASSELRCPIATSTSWSCTRRGWCAWTFPVATVRTPSDSARSRRAALRRASPRRVRALELDEEALRGRRRRARRAVASDLGRQGRRVHSPRGRRGRRALVERAQRSSRGFSRSARMRGREQAAEVRVAARRLARAA